MTEKNTKKNRMSKGENKEFDKFEKYDSNKAKKKNSLDKNGDFSPEKPDSLQKPLS
jgi:hypothetical protein